MSKTKAQDVEELDIKIESDFMKWLKRIAYIVTILATLSGGILGILSFVREVKDPRAQAGHTEHSQMLKENSQNIRENRNEIRFLYKAIISLKAKKDEPNTLNKLNKPLKKRKTIEERAKKLPDTPIQRPKQWKDLPIQRRAD